MTSAHHRSVVNAVVIIVFRFLFLLLFARQNISLGEITQSIRTVGDAVGFFADVVGVRGAVLQTFDAVNQLLAGVKDDQARFAVLTKLEELF